MKIVSVEVVYLNLIWHLFQLCITYLIHWLSRKEDRKHMKNTSELLEWPVSYPYLYITPVSAIWSDSSPIWDSQRSTEDRRWWIWPRHEEAILIATYDIISLLVKHTELHLTI